MLLMRIRRVRRWVALGVVTGFAIYLHERSPDDASVRTPMIARSASVPAVRRAALHPPVEDEATAFEPPVLEPPVLEPPILEEVRRIGEASSALDALPEPDRVWVLGSASAAFAVGQISQEML